MDQPLPRVVLTSRFYWSFGALLRETFKKFRREEGGYLLGRFRGDRVEVDAFYHDREAETSVGDVRLSTSAFDAASILARREGGRSILGTWHLHPPGFGAGYSLTDERMLFIDRMVLNATDPGDYVNPWVHLIVPGVDLDGMRAYTLDVDTAMCLSPGDPAVGVGRDIDGNGKFGLLVRPTRGQDPRLTPYPMDRRLLAAALRAGRFAGVWRRCPEGTPAPAGSGSSPRTSFVRSMQPARRAPRWSVAL